MNTNRTHRCGLRSWWRQLRPHWRQILILTGVILSIRIFPYYNLVFSEDGPLVWDPDAVYHLRRAELTTQNYPVVPVYDSYINHPDGAYVIWPPLYDLVLATVWLILKLIPGISSPISVIVLLPPLLMAAVCGVVYRTGLRLWPRKKWLACTVALAPALLPATVLYSYIGQLDHHAAEFLFIALIIDGLVKTLQNLPRNSTTRSTLRTGWMTGLFLGLGLLVQHGLLFMEAVILLSLILCYPRSGSNVWTVGAAVNTVAFLVTAPFGLYAHLNGVPFAHTHFGAFQPLIVMEASLFYFTLWLITSAAKTRMGKYHSLILITSVTLTLLAGGFLLQEIMAGATFILGTWSEWEEHIGEFQSILRLSPADALSQLGLQMSWLAVLIPVGWVLMLISWKRTDSGHRVLFIATAVFAVMGGLQIRYLPFLSLYMGIILGIAAMSLSRKLPKRAIAILFPLLVAAGYIPCLKAIGTKHITYDTFTQLHPILTWLDENTPDTSYYPLPDSSAEYGVLSEWSLGHYIQYYGRRPALADNFGEHASDLSRLTEFFLATENQSTYELLDRYNVRYVLCRGLYWTFQSLLMDEGKETYLAGQIPAGQSASEIVFSPRIYPTVLYRLTRRYGSAVTDQQGNYAPPLDRLRLVAESEAEDEQITSGPEIAQIKLFEYVSGAGIKLSGLSPGEAASITGIVHTPGERWFPYMQAVRADSMGSLTFTVPYFTGKEAGKSYVNKYTIRYNGQEKVLSGITEAMILRGVKVQLQW
ncbi:MAG: hypothetical protein QF551_04400 [Candidatus Marinimicrobia bacterium]|nr:hypothetical protein [Candidatus Neomarinimicrobiota bacterium]MDP6966496.1 hypothetical protein [Candidatus Neomarinimicrobiota bacterium]